MSELDDTQLPIYPSVMMDDMWTVAKELPPSSENRRKMLRVMKEFSRLWKVEGGLGKWYIDDLEATTYGS